MRPIQSALLFKKKIGGNREMKIIANLIKVGNVIKFKDKTFQVLNTNTIKPGKGGAFIQVEMRDIKVDQKLMRDLEHLKTLKKFQLQKCKQHFVTENNMITLMNNENYEQFTLSSELQIWKYRCPRRWYEVVSRVNRRKNGWCKTSKISQGFNSRCRCRRRQTASSSFKNATTTNNLKILVPQHIKSGDKIINSENFEYIEKAKE